MKNIFFAVLVTISSNISAAIDGENTTTGFPLISYIAIALAIVFFFIKNKFKGSFRANKTAVLVALLTLALLAWPFKFFEKSEQKNNIEQPK
jgi:hypothetical protein